MWRAGEAIARPSTTRRNACPTPRARTDAGARVGLDDGLVDGLFGGFVLLRRVDLDRLGFLGRVGLRGLSVFGERHLEALEAGRGLDLRLFGLRFLEFGHDWFGRARGGEDGGWRRAASGAFRLAFLPEEANFDDAWRTLLDFFEMRCAGACETGETGGPPESGSRTDA